MTDEDLEQALQAEVGATRLRGKPPTSDERYAVSSWVWSEWNRVHDQIGNIPWWKVNVRRRAWRKWRRFGVALDVLHHYVPARDVNGGGE